MFIIHLCNKGYENSSNVKDGLTPQNGLQNVQLIKNNMSSYFTYRFELIQGEPTGTCQDVIHARM